MPTGSQDIPKEVVRLTLFTYISRPSQIFWMLKTLVFSRSPIWLQVIKGSQNP